MVMAVEGRWCVTTDSSIVSCGGLGDQCYWNPRHHVQVTGMTLYAMPGLTPLMFTW